MDIPWEEYWSGLPFPPPGDLPDPVIEPAFPASPALAGSDYTVEVTNRFKGLDMIDRVPEELWTEICGIV